ncbi:MAG: hypothetical protein OXH69_20090 [Acidobacteria bacterium]|nr:hypothetical protein [Acidobacteriota bacterium]
MTALPHDPVAEIEPGDKSELPSAAVVLTLAHATFDDFLRLHARRPVTEQLGRRRLGGRP